MRTFWKTMNRVYEKTMLAIFVIALLISIYALYDTWYVFDHANDKSYLIFKPGVAEENGVVTNSPITSDMVGWITLDDTNIDYPVMQGTDNTVYLNKDPYGEFSLSGSIFLDSRNSSDFTDEYSVIYGHHMEYGVMFGALDDYLDEDYQNFLNTLKSRSKYNFNVDLNINDRIITLSTCTDDNLGRKVFHAKLISS